MGLALLEQVSVVSGLAAQTLQPRCSSRSRSRSERSKRTVCGLRLEPNDVALTFALYFDFRVLCASPTRESERQT